MGRDGYAVEGKISSASGGKLDYDLTLEQVEQQLDAALGRKAA